jgi:hypothetical protein
MNKDPWYVDNRRWTVRWFEYSMFFWLGVTTAQLLDWIG